MSEIDSYDDAAIKALEAQSFAELIAERDRLLVFNAELDRERVKAIEERDEALAALKIEQETFESFRLNAAHASKIDREEVEAALKRYGRHSEGCSQMMRHGHVCGCGLATALEEKL